MSSYFPSQFCKTTYSILQGPTCATNSEIGDRFKTDSIVTVNVMSATPFIIPIIALEIEEDVNSEVRRSLNGYPFPYL